LAEGHWFEQRCHDLIDALQIFIFEPENRGRAKKSTFLHIRRSSTDDNHEKS
jgi:hypothetical protein